MQSLGPFLSFSPSMPGTLACIAATDAFDDPALATADEDEQVASMRFITEGAARAAMDDGSVLRAQRTRSALWVFDTHNHVCSEAVVLDGAHVTAMQAAPKQKVRASLADVAAVTESASRGAAEARRARYRDRSTTAAGLGVGIEADDDDDDDDDDERSGDHDGSLLMAAGSGENDADELEQALGDGGALIVGTSDGRVEVLRAATEGAPGPGAEALASVHLSQATASIGGSSMGGIGAPRPRGVALASTDGLGSGGGRAGDRLAVGETADRAAVLSIGILQGETGLIGRGGPGGTPGADAPVVRMLASTVSGMHVFDIGIDMS